MSDEGWWITTKINFPFSDSSFKRSIMFSESLEDNPEVGSSTNIIEGSLMSSKAIFNLFLCPPLIVFSSGLPTFKSLVSYNPIAFSVCTQSLAICVSL